jgi:hypothetical protein
VRIVGSSGDRPTLWTVDAGGQVAGPVDLGSERGRRGAYARGVNVHGWVVGAGRTPHGDIPLLWLPKQAGDDGDGDPGTCTHPRGKCKQGNPGHVHGRSGGPVDVGRPTRFPRRPMSGVAGSFRNPLGGLRTHLHHGAIL